jgi:large subunit ribosomal protein L6
MSKIGRKPIDLADVKVELKDNNISFKGKKGSGEHTLPEVLKVVVDGNRLKILCDEVSHENKMLWGLHRALLANKIIGASEGFKEELSIQGLGFKAALAGKNLTFSLGYTHKITFPLPDGITVEVDKTGQNLVIKGQNKEQVGLVASQIKALRPTEPYKGTGIKRVNEQIIRKAGKTKAAA